MIRPPVEHIKQKGPHCLRAAASMAVDFTQKQFEEDVRLGGKYLLGGMETEDIFPFLYLNGFVAGPIPSFSVEPYVETNTDNMTYMPVDKQVYLNICIIAEQEGETPERLVHNLLKDELERRGISSGAIDYSKKNGLQEKFLDSNRIAGFNIKVSIDQPAIVAVNTGSGERVGHAVYWSGEKLYDPDCDEAKLNFDDYSIRQWIPLIKIDPPSEKIIGYIRRKERVERWDAAALSVSLSG